MATNIVQSVVNPDEFYVFKPILSQNKNPIIQKKLGDKKRFTDLHHFNSLKLCVPLK
jgi:phosphoenolpyruvate synthase/pyruvate phosphate dikinase